MSDDISVLLDDLDFKLAQTKPNASYSDLCMKLWISVQFQTYTSTVVSIFLASLSVPTYNLIVSYIKRFHFYMKLTVKFLIFK